MKVYGQQKDSPKRGRPALATQDRISEAVKQKGSFTHTEIQAVVGGSMTSVNKGIRLFLEANPNLVEKPIQLSEKFIRVITQEITKHVEELVSVSNQELQQARYDHTILSEALEAMEIRAEQCDIELQNQISLNHELKAKQENLLERIRSQEIGLLEFHEKTIRAEMYRENIDEIKKELSEAKGINDNYNEKILQLKTDLLIMHSRYEQLKSEQSESLYVDAQIDRGVQIYAPQTFYDCLPTKYRIIESKSEIISLAMELIQQHGPLPTGKILKEVNKNSRSIVKPKNIAKMLSRSGSIIFNSLTKCWTVAETTI